MGHPDTCRGSVSKRLDHVPDLEKPSKVSTSCGTLRFTAKRRISPRSAPTSSLPCRRVSCTRSSTVSRAGSQAFRPLASRPRGARSRPWRARCSGRPTTIRAESGTEPGHEEGAEDESQGPRKSGTPSKKIKSKGPSHLTSPARSKQSRAEAKATKPPSSPKVS